MVHAVEANVLSYHRRRNTRAVFRYQRNFALGTRIRYKSAVGTGTGKAVEGRPEAVDRFLSKNVTEIVVFRPEYRLKAGTAVAIAVLVENKQLITRR